MREFITQSPLETENLAENFAKELVKGDIIAFHGGMGMGKTAFTRGLARGLGINDDVSSPTFALCNEYRGEDITLYHFDMFRIESFEDLYSTGFFDYMDMNGIMAVEWSENVARALPDNAINIYIEIYNENYRKITIDSEGRF